MTQDYLDPHGRQSTASNNTTDIYSADWLLPSQFAVRNNSIPCVHLSTSMPGTLHSETSLALPWPVPDAGKPTARCLFAPDLTHPVLYLVKSRVRAYVHNTSADRTGRFFPKRDYVVPMKQDPTTEDEF
jgi:hypothetical protein